jgi:hypothetical protein
MSIYRLSNLSMTINAKQQQQCQAILAFCMPRQAASRAARGRKFGDSNARDQNFFT